MHDSDGSGYDLPKRLKQDAYTKRPDAPEDTDEWRASVEIEAWRAVMPQYEFRDGAIRRRREHMPPASRTKQDWERAMTDAEKVARLSESLAWALCELYGLKKYMARSDRGEYGVECAVCMNEWFDESDLTEMDNARQILNACGGSVPKHPKE